MTTTPPDPRETAAEIGRATGREELANQVLSGELDARMLTPMLAGMVDGVVRQLFGPVVGVRSWDEFDPAAQPAIGVATLRDGSKIRITIEAAE